MSDLPNYSARSAVSGSTRAARQAGITQAMSAAQPVRPER